MNDKFKFIFLLITSLSLLIGTIFVATQLFSLGNSTWAIVLILVMIVIICSLTLFIKRSYHNLKLGLPSDDERTKKVRMYAAGYAYFMSLYVWLLLFSFHRYLDSDDLLMFGLLGMVISFYVSWVLLNRKRDIA